MPRLLKAFLLTALLISQPLVAADFAIADRVIVRKSERKLLLMKGDQVLKAADIALGLVPVGHKRREGDFRTPEGVYTLAERNPDSDFFLSIRVSYPNARDESLARRHGRSPGGQIMVHGLPNRPTHSDDYYRRTDWTDGCIAVSNSDMVDIWLMTVPDTPIHILP